jgi:hypothetical protein
MTGGEKQPEPVAFEGTNGHGATAPAVTASTTAPSTKPAWGIAQANELMSTVVGSDRNADLVLRVIRNTLESVGVHVGDLITQARGLEGELGTKIERHRSTIAELQRQIEAEQAAITDLEAELALTRHTRDGLERSQVGLGPSPVQPATGASARPAPPRVPIPLGARDARDNDRPTAVAVSPELGETRLSESDIQSLPPDDPRFNARKR